MTFGFLDSLPIAVVCVLVALSLVVACEVGYWFGTRAKTRHDAEAPSSLGPMVGGLLGMLAFVLAFTFSMAASLHEARKQNVLQEANTVGTAYLRSDLVSSGEGPQIRKLLREYVDVRLGAATGADLQVAIKRSQEIHSQLWGLVAKAAVASPSANASLVVQSINEVIDVHLKRLTAAVRNRIPTSIWIALAAISILSMITMGVQVGLGGKRRLIAVVPMSLALAVLVALIVDLDRPGEGLLQVEQHAMVDLRKSMER